MTTKYHSSSAPYPIEQTLTMTANTASRLAETVSSTIGFDPERIGLNSIIRAAHVVQARSKISTIEALEKKVLHDPECRQLFIESLVIPESWLFREPKVFEHINALLGQRLKKQSQVMILSAPCATGEEACSIALSLLESGHSQTRFHIIATDISRHAIKQARSGLFSRTLFVASMKHERKNGFLQRQKAGSWLPRYRKQFNSWIEICSIPTLKPN